MAWLCHSTRFLFFPDFNDAHHRQSANAPLRKQPKLAVLCSSIEVDYSKAFFRLKQQGIETTPRVLRRLRKLQIWKKRRRDRKEKERADKVTHPLWYSWPAESSEEKRNLAVEAEEEKNADEFLFLVKDQRPALRISVDARDVSVQVRTRSLRVGLKRPKRNSRSTSVELRDGTSASNLARDKTVALKMPGQDVLLARNERVPYNTAVEVSPLKPGINEATIFPVNPVIVEADISPLKLGVDEASQTSRINSGDRALDGRHSKTIETFGGEEQRTAGYSWRTLDVYSVGFNHEFTEDTSAKERHNLFISKYANDDTFLAQGSLARLEDRQLHEPVSTDFQRDQISGCEVENKPDQVESFFVDEDTQKAAEVWIKGLGCVRKIKPPFSKELKDMILAQRKDQWEPFMPDELDELTSEELNSTSHYDFDGKLAIAEDKKIQKLAARLKETDYWTSKVRFRKVMHSGRLKLTEDRVLRLVQILGEWGKWRRAMQVVQWVHKRQLYRFQKSRYVFTTLLSVLEKANRPVEALRVLNVMRESFSSYPDMAAYHVIAVTLGQSGHLRELLEVIESLKIGSTKGIEGKPDWRWKPSLHPDVVIYNAVLNACIISKEWMGVHWILREMSKSGVQPNGATYGLTIEAMVKAGNFDVAVHYYNRMEKAGFPPNAQTYRWLIEVFGKAGKPDEAIELFNNMEASGVVPVASVYYALAISLCMSGRLRDALVQVKKLQEIPSKKPDVVTYTGLIRACFSVRQIQDAIFLFHHMQQQCAPNLETCNWMIRIYGVSKMFDEARFVFEAVIRGWLGNPKCYRAAKRLRCNVLTFELMLKSCVISERWDYFECVYGQMVAHGHYVSGKTSLWLMVRMANQGKIHEVDDMIYKMRKKGEVPGQSLYEAQILACLQQGQREKAFGYLTDMATDGFDSSFFAEKYFTEKCLKVENK